MKVDFSVNLPTIVTLIAFAVGYLWRVAQLEERIRALIDWQKVHQDEDDRRHEQGERRFGALEMGQAECRAELKMWGSRGKL